MRAPAPCGPTKFMSGQRKQIDAERTDVDRNAAKRLHRIAEQISTMVLHDMRGLSDRMNHAGFIVGQHQCHERSACGAVVRRQRALEFRQINDA